MAGGGKMSPRQKMINMMYLVLMALLALNVSEEILDSFHLFEVSFNRAATNIDAKNDATMSALQAQLDEKPAKTKPFMDRALQAKKIADDFVKYVDDVKLDIEKLYGGGDAKEARVDGDPKGKLVAADQMEKHANYFVNEKHGVEFQNRINKTRTDLLALLKPDDSDSLFTITDLKVYKEVEDACQLVADDPEGDGPKKATWVSQNLEHVPASGLMAIFSRIKNDAKTLEADVLEKLASQVDAKDFKFDKLSAKVLAKSNYVMEGENYEADILLVASNSTGEPEIYVGDTKVPTEAGMGKFKRPASGVGIKTFAGKIVVGDEEFTFEEEFTVFKPAATIAATEMNLLYKGIDNPMSISVPGFAASDVKISAPGLNLKSLGGGKYNAKVPGSTSKEVTITASITRDGKTKTVGSQKFRVRSLPQPTAQLGGIPNDGLPKGKASVGAQSAIIASMGAGFAYNLKYRVTGFKLIMAYKRKPPVMKTANGGTLTGEMRSLIKGAKPGDRILIEGIRATEAKYGFKANLSPIIITIR
ncbi:MAG: gliding motility protein GldM [Bacteroidetes bacterium]|nr:gliding motility protein GldM [Bacteroidota bacterium]